MKSTAASGKTRQYSQTTRAQSAEATAQRIIDAFLKHLFVDWFDEITLDAVAADAGVTVQTIVRRFGGKEGLLASAVTALGERINASRVAPAGDVHRLLTALMQDYEQTGDMVIRLLALEPRHPSLKKFIDFGRAEHRGWVSQAFAEVFEKLEPSPRQRAIDSFVIITDVYTWKLLRRDMGRSVAATITTMKSLISSTIAECSNFTA